METAILTKDTQLAEAQKKHDDLVVERLNLNAKIAMDQARVGIMERNINGLAASIEVLKALNTL